jgi:hypothetical protein
MTSTLDEVIRLEAGRRVGEARAVLGLSRHTFEDLLTRQGLARNSAWRIEMTGRFDEAELDVVRSTLAEKVDALTQQADAARRALSELAALHPARQDFPAHAEGVNETADRTPHLVLVR